MPPASTWRLAEHRPGHALPRAFHVDPDIHAHELDAIWRASWLFAGVSAQAREPGDFFAFELGDDSIIVVRDDDGELHALHNTCRHRGMPVCAEHAGSARRWVCPYHQWSYALDGRAARLRRDGRRARPLAATACTAPRSPRSAG